MKRQALLAVAALSGCVDGFQGSNVQFDFAQGTPVQASAYTPQKPNQLPANVSLRLYAVDESTTRNALYEVQRFEIHRIVDLSSPCFIDVGPHVPHPGLHVSEFQKQIQADDMIPDIANPPTTATEQQKIDVATAIQRQNNVALLASDVNGIAIVSGASTATYPAIDANCNGSGLPPPSCTDDASNKRRLDLCQASWKKDAVMFEGTDRVLTSPLNGVTYGMVDGLNPVNFGPVGGAQFFVDTNLERFTTYAIYWQYDDADGDGKPDYPSTVPADQRSDTGTLLYYGHTSMATRGVIHAHLTGVTNSQLAVELAIFANLGSDSVTF